MSNKKNAISEYRALSKMGFISLEEVESEEASHYLSSASNHLSSASLQNASGKQINTVPPKEKKKVDTSWKIQELEEKVELPGWNDLPGISPFLLKGLKEANFLEPTLVQKEVLSILLPPPKQGKKRKDVLGCAPTGSGKTLAFLLPILNAIIQEGKDAHNFLFALVIAPTRELALQIQEHFGIISKHCSWIKAMTLVGGLSGEKQERLLGYQPNIIIGTPGRLAEVFETHENLKGSLSTLRFLVLDEADRLVEAGHFQDLDILFDLVFSKPNPQRQTLLFSATLDIQGTPGEGGGSSVGQGLGQLRRRIRFNDPRPALIQTDVSKSSPPGLKHWQLLCTVEEKNACLFYLLKQPQRGRTLVFVNTIELVKDLASMLQSLGLDAIPLHAKMQQRQRIKNLERFKTRGNTVLVTSDVAARGIDIPTVDCVIHYHVPRTADIYVHRSGRTARMNQSGDSISLVAPHEKSLLGKIVSTKRIAITDHPLNLTLLETLQECISLAKKIVTLESSQSKDQRMDTWEKRAADILGVDLDEGPRSSKKRIKDEDGDGGPASKRNKQNLHQVASLKRDLKEALGMIRW